MYSLKNGQEVQLIIDTWEGQPELPLDQLRIGDVVGVFPRINSISGGHHFDDRFLATWEAGFRCMTTREPLNTPVRP